MADASENQAQTRKTLLLVEDDAFVRDALAKTLDKNGFNVRQAENGLIGKTIFDLAKDSIDLIISDIRMPGLDGVALLQHVRLHSQVPFVVITGFSEILESRDAFRLGASDFITKPFRPDDILKVIDTCLNPPAAAEAILPAEVKVSEKYCPIHIDDFLTASTLLSDIFVRLSETKFIRAAYEGDEIPVDRLRTYKEKAVEFLYVTLADFAKYVGFSIKVTGAALKSDQISVEKKARLLKQTTEVLVGQCFLGELSHEFVKPAQQMVEDTIAIIAEDPEMVDLFSDLQSNADRQFAQGVAVAVYGSLVARLHGWNSAQTLFKIILGGLLHDIGNREIDPDIVRKKRYLRTVDEIRAIESHTRRGRDIVLALPKLPQDISTIVFQHHENPMGTGYPGGLTRQNIHPIALLVATVDQFIQLILPIEDGAEPLSRLDALEKLRQYADTCDRSFLNRLFQLFGLQQSQSSV